MNPEGPPPGNPKTIIKWIALLLIAGYLLSFLPSFEEEGKHIRAILVVTALATAISLILLKTERFLSLASLAIFVLMALAGYSYGRYFLLKHYPPKEASESPKRAQRTLLYISPVRFLSQQGFYSRVVDELVQQGKQSEFEVALWPPDQDFSVTHQMGLLKKAVEQQSRFGVVIFTPFKIERSEDEDNLLRVLSQMKESHVILFDTDVSDELRQKLVQHRVNIPPCVAGNNEKGAQLAADALLRYFSGRFTTPIVAMYDQPRPNSRGISFRRALQRPGTGVTPTITTWTETDFGRYEAKRLALDKLSGGQRIDAIFGGNDVSALGARDAIVQLLNRNVLSVQNIRIVGYDGIEEVLQLIENGDKLFIDSVNVHIPEQVRNIVTIANQLLAGKGGERHRAEETCRHPDPVR